MHRWQWLLLGVSMHSRHTAAVSQRICRNYVPIIVCCCCVLHGALHVCRIVTHELSQLRAANVAAIRAARAAGIASGALTADSRGFDMAPAPEVGQGQHSIQCIRRHWPFALGTWQQDFKQTSHTACVHTGYHGTG